MEECERAYYFRDEVVSADPIHPPVGIFCLAHLDVSELSANCQDRLPYRQLHVKSLARQAGNGGDDGCGTAGKNLAHAAVGDALDKLNKFNLFFAHIRAAVAQQATDR